MTRCSSGVLRVRVHVDELFEAVTDAVAFDSGPFDDVQFGTRGADGLGLAFAAAGAAFEAIVLGAATSVPSSLSGHACVIRALVEPFAPSCGNRSGQFHRAQSDGRRSWIVGDFLRIRLDGAAGQFLEERHHVGRHHGHIRRSVDLKPLVHEGFDGFVFQRVVRLHHQTSSHCKVVGDLRQRAGKLVQFAVDFVRSAWKTRFAGVAGGTVGLRHDLVHQTIELARRGQRLDFRRRTISRAICLETAPRRMCGRYAPNRQTNIRRAPALRSGGCVTSIRMSSGASWE